MEQCTELESDDQASMEYGVNRKSVLTELRFFNICNGSLLPDVMHDVLEGVLQYEAKLVLYHLIRECRCMKLSHFNHLIETVELGYMENKNRPSPVKLNMEDRSLRQNGMCELYRKQNRLALLTVFIMTASQMWLLGRLLPILIGNAVPPHNERWQNYLLLLDIVSLLFARRITEDTSTMMRA